MDFTKYYIIQLLQSSVTKIRFTDQSKKSILQNVIYRLERSNDLFLDLKLMERVYELEELAQKLISIYRRIRKSTLDLERISNQFTNDRDAIQLTVYRFIKGLRSSSSLGKPRPKIVFDDTTLTFYEISDSQQPQHTDEDIETDQKRIELEKFLSTDDLKPNLMTEDSENFDQTQQIEIINEKIEVNNNLIEKNFSPEIDIKREEKQEENLLLSFEFDNEIVNQNYIPTQNSINNENDQIEVKGVDVSEKITLEEVKDKVADEVDLSHKETPLDDESTENLEGELPLKEIKDESESSLLENLQSNLQNLEKTLEDEYLEFETKLLNNIIDVDFFLNSILKQNIDENLQFRLIANSYDCLLLAEKLGHELVAQLIKTYWSALLAIRDGKVVVDKAFIEKVQSVLIILVSLLKNKEIDYEPFWIRINNLKEELKNLSYEV